MKLFIHPTLDVVLAYQGHMSINGTAEEVELFARNVLAVLRKARGVAKRATRARTAP